MRSLRCLLASLAMLAILLAPAAAAQPKPLITVKISWAHEHEMMLDEDGRGDMGTVVEVFGEDFVCSQPLKFKVELDIKELPKVYGSSMGPKVVPADEGKYFVFEAGKVGVKPASSGDKAVNSPNQDGNLDIAWDLDGIPEKDAKFDYVIKGAVKSDGSGGCTPTPEFRVIESPPMTVKIADRLPPEERKPDEQKCLENPAAFGCETVSTPEDPVATPAPGALLLALGVLGLVGILRRRNARS